MIQKLTTKLSLAFAAVGLFAFNAHAGSREIVPVPVQITVSQSQNEFEKLELKADEYFVHYDMEDSPGSHFELDCDTDVGDGSQGNWAGFFNAPKAQKAQALADAIVGIGVSTARKILDAGYFKSKPRSWNAFKNLMKEISRDNRVDASDVYYNVIEVNGQTNAQNLGYQSNTNCQWVLVPNGKVPVKKMEKMQTFTTSVNLRFENSILLKSEKEIFAVSFDGKEVSVAEKSVLNRYTQSQAFDHGQNVITYKGIERLKATPEASTIIAFIRKEKGTLKLEIEDSLLDEINKVSPNTLTQIDYEVIRTSGIDNTEANGSLQLRSNSKATVDLANDPTWEKKTFGGKKSLTSGKSYKVRLRISRLGTELFSQKQSAPSDTAEVTY